MNLAGPTDSGVQRRVLACVAWHATWPPWEKRNSLFLFSHGASFSNVTPIFATISIVSCCYYFRRIPILCKHVVGIFEFSSCRHCQAGVWKLNGIGLGLRTGHIMGTAVEFMGPSLLGTDLQTGRVWMEGNLKYSHSEKDIIKEYGEKYPTWTISSACIETVEDIGGKNSNKTHFNYCKIFPVMKLLDNGCTLQVYKQHRSFTISYITLGQATISSRYYLCASNPSTSYSKPLHIINPITDQEKEGKEGKINRKQPFPPE